MISQSISKNSMLLGLFAVLTTGASVLTFTLTNDRFEANQKAALESRLAEVMPDTLHDNDLLSDTVDLEHPIQTGPIYLAFDQGQPAGAIVPTVAPEGYGGAIQLLVGIHYDGSVSGVRIVPPHLETPGLGDAIDAAKSDWVLSFNGRSLQDPKADLWKVKKDGGTFDQFTGATITPRAVVKAVKETLHFYHEKRDALYLQHSLNQLEDDAPAEAAQSANAIPTHTGPASH